METVVGELVNDCACDECRDVVAVGDAPVCRQCSVTCVVPSGELRASHVRRSAHELRTITNTPQPSVASRFARAFGQEVLRGAAVELTIVLAERVARYAPELLPRRRPRRKRRR